MVRQRPRDPYLDQRFCRGCGCTEHNACTVTTPAGPQGCSWVLLDMDTPTGICSACAIMTGWDQGAMIALGFAAPEGDPAGELTLADFNGDHARTLVLP